MTASWRAAHDVLAARARALPDLLRVAAAADMPPPRLGLGAVRRVVTTGVGSSAAQARLLAWILAERLGCDARFRPLGAFLEPTPAGSCDDLLVVVSQGLAPNARVALADLAAWRHVVVVTATQAAAARAGGRADAAALVERLADVGVEIRHFEGAEEYGTLLRVTGPMLGLLAVVRYAAALAVDAGRSQALPVCDGPTLAAAVTRAGARAAASATRSIDERGSLALGGFRSRALDRFRALALLASGDYATLVENLRLKILEGLLCPLPPVWDLLDLGHGPVQQAFPAAATWLALTRPDAAREAELLQRCEAMLDPTRHHVLRLDATLPLPWSLFEHEAMLNEIVLAGIAAHGIDQARWPGQGRDRPLYVVGSESEADAIVPGESRDGEGARAATMLAELTWPTLADALAAGSRVALVPLGATEQHGPHLPFATDTIVGDALAARLAARLPEAIAIPTLPFGCSREHLDFAGTLDLGEDTLAAVLGDVLASLARHGFAGAFVFSAHGGNYAALAAMLPRLAAAATPMPIAACTDLAAVTAALAAVAAGFGITAEVAGHHAGELETSIMLALQPSDVRGDALAAGHVAPVADAQTLFYPSLRATVPSGTVGDPRAASAARAAAYLDAWVDVLLAAYRRAKNTKYAQGTKSA
jgi:creatinine amidohydrolase/Fe(II)-dependent formamide hydrolase-like protein